MVKKCMTLLVALALLVVAACAPAEGPSETGAVTAAVESFYAEIHADADVEILSVEIDKDHAIVKVKVDFPPDHLLDIEHGKVFLEKYGEEWEVAFTTGE